MIIIDENIVSFMIFTPLVSAVFITFIPTNDTGSKLAVSRFFSIIGFLFFLRIAYIFFNHKLTSPHNFSFTISQISINFNVFISEHNLFLFGALSIVLMANMILYELNDTKSNIHQVAPFVLTFILFASFGQKDIKVALPIISISNFIIYFLIGYSEKNRRGTTIFHTGIFLFTCDALALVLLQYGADDFTQLAILLPGLSRISLPLCAPFMKNLFLNLDEAEGPFILSFLHLSGFLILLLSKYELTLDQSTIALVVGIISAFSAIYIALEAINERKINTIYYYFLTFYSTLTGSVIFLLDSKQSWWVSSQLVLVNIAIFMHTARSALLVNQYRVQGNYKSRIRATWFLSICLLVGIPGLGIGTVLWPTFYLFYQKIIIMPEPLNNLWSVLLLLWLCALILLAYAMLLIFRIDYNDKNELKTAIFEHKKPIKISFVYAPFFIIFIAITIPLITTYMRIKGKIL